MQKTIEHKLNAMFWDFPPAEKQKAVKRIIKDPVAAFNDEKILIRALSTLGWYELIGLTGGSGNLLKFLNDSTINRMFPEAMRIYYKDAKRLLSKYIVPVTG